MLTRYCFGVRQASPMLVQNLSENCVSVTVLPAVRILVHVQVTIYRGLLIGRDGHLDQSEAYDVS